MEYAVITTRAKMPSSCWGGSKYSNVGLIEYDPKFGLCYQIRSTKHQTVIDYDTRLYDGITENCAAGRARSKMEDLQEKLEIRQLMAYLAIKAGYKPVFKAMLPNDAIAIAKTSTIIRYNAKWHKLGVAIRMPKDLIKDFGCFEHGKTRQECRNEIARKRQVFALRQAQEKLTRRQNRMASLLARISTCKVNYDMVRNTGACDAGIQSWCNVRNVPLNSSIDLATLAHDAIAYPYALKIAKGIIAQHVNQ